ncbi:MAG: tetratricopeptide repeat protein, partial [Candidatus Eisenbacteria bacterium]|nr:tetratricopeptide repeat protein [Candidatus Eisenbacteria bacterium]
ILKDEPPPLSEQNRSLPQDLEQVVHRCLSKDPAQRFPNAGALRDELERVRQSHRGKSSPTAPPHQRGRRALGVALGLSAVLVLSALFVLRRDHGPPRVEAVGASGRPSIAVFEFRTHGGTEEMRWLASGVPSMLLTGLAQTPGLDVVSSARVEEILEKIGKQRATEIDQAILAEVARRSGAGAAVIGNIFYAGETLRIDVQVEDVETGKLLFAKEATGRDVFPIVDELAVAIRQGLSLEDTGPERSIAEVSSPSLDAYRAFNEGMQAYYSQRFPEAIAAFESALAFDPDFAMAHARLALSLLSQRESEVGREHLERAHALSDRLPEREKALVEADYQLIIQQDVAAAKRTLENLLLRYPDEVSAYLTLSSQSIQGGDRSAALAVLRRGVETVPRSGPLRNMYAYDLRNAGDTEEAIRQLEIYRQLEPEEVNPVDSMGEIYLTSGQPERALSTYAEAIALDPTFASAERGRALALACLGRFPEALTAYNRSLEIVEKSGQPTLGLHSPKAFLLLGTGRYRAASQEARADDIPAEDGADTTSLQSSSMVEMVRAFRAERYGDCVSAAATARSSLPADVPAIYRRAAETITRVYEGTAEANVGHLDRAREIQLILEQEPHPLATWAPRWLAGEIALSEGDLAAAETAFREGIPQARSSFSNSQRGLLGSLLINTPASRDWKPRLLEHQGDLAGAIEEYRTLNQVETDTLFVSFFDPRYLSRIAGLQARRGDHDAAARSYREFLEYWADADPDLPEMRQARTYLDSARDTP